MIKFLLECDGTIQNVKFEKVLARDDKGNLRFREFPLMECIPPLPLNFDQRSNTKRKVLCLGNFGDSTVEDALEDVKPLRRLRAHTWWFGGSLSEAIMLEDVVMGKVEYLINETRNRDARRRQLTDSGSEAMFIYNE
ncbi:hypothetical protein L1887_40264 [Cichorium endivia]|nr:hypothetical protein L1887_40264 [Cichorium endivia]